MNIWELTKQLNKSSRKRNENGLLSSERDIHCTQAHEVFKIKALIVDVIMSQFLFFFLIYQLPFWAAFSMSCEITHFSFTLG